MTLDLKVYDIADKHVVKETAKRGGLNQQEFWLRSPVSFRCNSRAVHRFDATSRMTTAFRVLRNTAQARQKPGNRR